MSDSEFRRHKLDFSIGRMTLKNFIANNKTANSRLLRNSLTHKTVLLIEKENQNEKISKNKTSRQQTAFRSMRNKKFWHKQVSPRAKNAPLKCLLLLFTRLSFSFLFSIYFFSLARLLLLLLLWTTTFRFPSVLCSKFQLWNLSDTKTNRRTIKLHFRIVFYYITL